MIGTRERDKKKKNPSQCLFIDTLVAPPLHPLKGEHPMYRFGYIPHGVGIAEKEKKRNAHGSFEHLAPDLDKKTTTHPLPRLDL